MQSGSHEQMARLCYDVAQHYSIDVPPWERVALLIGTAAVETGLMRNISHVAGRISGLGLWNIRLSNVMTCFSEEFAQGWIFTSKSARMPWKLFVTSWLGISSVKAFMPSQREVRYLLVHDDKFACAMAMWLYFGKLDSLGENLTQVADFWYKHYPSDHAKREAVDFLDAWSSCECEILMTSLGYH